MPYDPEKWPAYCAKNRDRIRKHARDRYWADRRLILEREAKYRRENPAWKRLRERKLKAIQQYGGKCSRCGFEDWRALQFDHISDDGTRDRLRARDSAFGYYDYIMTNTAKFQLLCGNCNWIKRFENNEHAGYKEKPSRIPPV